MGVEFGVEMTPHPPLPNRNYDYKDTCKINTVRVESQSRTTYPPTLLTGNGKKQKKNNKIAFWWTSYLSENNSSRFCMDLHPYVHPRIIMAPLKYSGPPEL